MIVSHRSYTFCLYRIRREVLDGMQSGECKGLGKSILLEMRATEKALQHYHCCCCCMGSSTIFLKPMHFERQKQFLMLQLPHFSSTVIPTRPVSLPSTLQPLLFFFLFSWFYLEVRFNLHSLNRCKFQMFKEHKHEYILCCTKKQ